ncbi:MAG: Tm-1-like ATP-binding domain-containing protein [Fibrobacteria bacterium]
MKACVYAIASLDSKGRELVFLGDAAREAGAEVVLVDVSLKGPPQIVPDVGREQVAESHPGGRGAVFTEQERETAIHAMSEALTRFLLAELAAGRLQGAVGLGGSEGTALIAPALRALPLGVPKLMVSTLASGDTRPYVGTSDLTMVFPVSDIAGLNFLSRQVLRNAAFAIAGMAGVGAAAKGTAPAVGLTMFGVTTPCVDMVRAGLEAKGWEGVVFHAVGTGGAAMEEMAARGGFRALMDLTTTEVADALLGGIFPAVPGRFDAVALHNVPAVMSLGALDMVNFGPRPSLHARFRHRLLYSHTPLVTLMRTSPEENTAIGRFIAQRLNMGRGPCVVLLPEHGISALDAPGQPFHDPAADEALFRALETGIRPTRIRRVQRVPFHINDMAFASAALEALEEVLRDGEGGT